MQPKVHYRHHWSWSQSAILLKWTRIREKWRTLSKMSPSNIKLRNSQIWFKLFAIIFPLFLSSMVKCSPQLFSLPFTSRQMKTNFCYKNSNIYVQIFPLLMKFPWKLAKIYELIDKDYDNIVSLNARLFHKQ